MLKIIFIISLVISLVYGLLLVSCYNFDISTNSKNNPATLKQISNYLGSKSYFNEIEFANNYKGKTVYIAGKPQRIESSGKVLFDTQRVLFSLYSIDYKVLVCKFDNSKQLESIKFNKKILFSGEISYVKHDKFSIHLNKCKLLQ